MVSHGASKWFDTGLVEVDSIPSGQCDTSACSRFILEYEMSGVDPSQDVKDGLAETLKTVCTPKEGCHMADPRVGIYIAEVRESNNA